MCSIMIRWSSRKYILLLYGEAKLFVLKHGKTQFVSGMQTYNLLFVIIYLAHIYTKSTVCRGLTHVNKLVCADDRIDKNLYNEGECD